MRGGQRDVLVSPRRGLAAPGSRSLRCLEGSAWLPPAPTRGLTLSVCLPLRSFRFVLRRWAVDVLLSPRSVARLRGRRGERGGCAAERDPGPGPSPCHSLAGGPAIARTRQAGALPPPTCPRSPAAACAVPAFTADLFQHLLLFWVRSQILCQCHVGVASLQITCLFINMSTHTRFLAS